VPEVTRERTVRAAPDEVWRVVSDPYALARWWPSVVRVEDVEPDGTAWTKVMRTPRGRNVRADFTRTALEAPRRVEWRMELEESPFERIFSSAVTAIELSAAADGEAGTRVSIGVDERLRGIRNRLGRFWVRRAAGRRLDEALDGLERVLGAA
jgi:uncharacterized protein YndB with AHSA1/START domain